MNPVSHLIDSLPEIEQRLGYVFGDRSLLFLAFVHCSYVNEDRMVSEHNERLEFLGDSVLGLLIADHLFLKLPGTPEGELSHLRSRLVEATSCIQFVKKLDVGSLILLGKGERMNDGRGRDSILADLFEAIIGAIYLDGGLNAAKKFLFTNFEKEINVILEKPVTNWKALLQDFCQKKFQKTPTYSSIDESGPDHSKLFTVAVLLQEKKLGEGQGASKKEAQQAAAQDALSRFDWQELKQNYHG